MIDSTFNNLLEIAGFNVTYSLEQKSRSRSPSLWSTAFHFFFCLNPFTLLLNKIIEHNLFVQII